MKKQTIRVQVVDDNGEAVGFPVTFQGRECWTLQKLMAAKEGGITAIDNIGPRLSHYVFKLRSAGITIQTDYEKHGGEFPGVHARYTLRSRVAVVSMPGNPATLRPAIGESAEIRLDAC